MLQNCLPSHSQTTSVFANGAYSFLKEMAKQIRNTVPVITMTQQQQQQKLALIKDRFPDD